MIGDFSLELARSAAQFAEARRLRDDVYRTRLGLDTRQWTDEDERDQAGYPFLLRENGVLVGTGRAVRTDLPACEIRALGQLPAHLTEATDVCEVGRIATRRRTDGIPASFVLLGLGAQWLLEHTGLRRYVAYARVPMLSRYQLIGAIDMGTRFQIPDRGDAQYAVILGDLADAAAAVRRLGPTPTAAEVR